MTTTLEAKLVRETEMTYATVTDIIDYDIWKDGSEVTLDEVLKDTVTNEEAIKRTVEAVIHKIPDGREADNHSALEGTVNTPDGAVPVETKTKLAPFIGGYVD